ncbi:gas vesicle protein [bacterium]|nr:gas vesicle protein [bacterium]
MEQTGLHPIRPQSSGLVDILDRILDKGLVIAGDIKISLAEVELLTIRIRLIVCSLDKAQEIGLDWWLYDKYLAPGKWGRSPRHDEALAKQIQALERKVAALTASGPRRSLEGTRKDSKHRRRGNNAR